MGLLNEFARADRSWGEESMKDDVEFIGKQVQRLKAAAAVPARNYSRIVSICDGLREVAVAARRPENAAVRPKLAGIVKRVAGIFSEVDTVDDLDFERRGKGHHGEGQK